MRRHGHSPILLHAVLTLPPQAVAKSFGFSTPPRVQLALESKTKHTRKAANLMAQLGARAGKKVGGLLRGGKSLPAPALLQRPALQPCSLVWSTNSRLSC